MLPPPQREAAKKIWMAGIDAVRAESVVKRHVRLDEKRNAILVGEAVYPIAQAKRLCIVGGGKAAGYLAKSIEEILEPVADRLQLHGWINVPDNCVVPTKHVSLHAARSAGVNEPRPEGIIGTQNILGLVASLQPSDLCLCLITGGGSALLPAPAPGISLQDKLNVTRLMSERGASIQELNRVRTVMSSIKGGGLSRACKANRMVTLIVSDVLGDPLSLIASGPTVLPTTNQHATQQADSAINILRRFSKPSDFPASLWRYFEQAQARHVPANESNCVVTHHVLANNNSAVQAAAEEARAQGYAVQIIPPEEPNAVAEEVATQLIDFCRQWQNDAPRCLIWGGEPTVRLAPEGQRGIGGRNQQLVLSALSRWPDLPDAMKRQLCVLSGGTDGEDGPTDAAGAFVDQSVVDSVHQQQLNVADHLARNDAYTFFDSVDALIRTGPTHTNVCDLRIAVAH